VKFWCNLVGYQIVWFSAVIGASRGLWWSGVVAAGTFAILHLALVRQTRTQRVVDIRLMAVAIGCGLLMDGSLSLSGLAHYAASDIALPSGGAPLWILSMWAAFALTLRHSMTFLLNRTLLAAVFGGIGGPLAYLGASRGWQAIDFAEPRWAALLTLAIGWGIAILLLTTRAARWSKSGTAPTTVPGSAA